MKKLFTLIIVLIHANYGMAQGNLWERVTTTANWDNDGVYMLTQTKIKNKVNYYIACNWRQNNASDAFVGYYTDDNKRDLLNVTESVMLDMSLFKIIKENDNWYIYDIKQQKYIDDASKDNNIKLIEKNESRPINISFEDDLVRIAINTTRIIKTIPANWIIRTYALSNTSAVLPMLFKLKNYTILDGQNSLSATQSIDKKVLMYRNFFTDIYNTLILPCDVANYKGVFGDGVTAYEVTGMTEENIYIKEVASEDLTAGKPYLLKGSSFNESPYLFGIQTVDYDGATDPVTSYSGGTVHGVYATRSVPENAFIMYNDQFIPYQKDKIEDQAMTISPYKWYVETNGSHAAKRITLQTASTTAIKTPRKVDNNHQTTIYTLSGQRIEKDALLRKGIYIVEKKKVMMK